MHEYLAVAIVFELIEIRTCYLQESSSSDEANADSANRQAAVSRPPSAAGSQTLPRPGSAYGSLPPAPSPAGSVGSRSNTPASLSGQIPHISAVVFQIYQFISVIDDLAGMQLPNIGKTGITTSDGLEGKISTVIEHCLLQAVFY